MDTFDPAGEYLRISERYRQMSDEELLVLVPQNSELTPFAQQALASEVRQRGLQSEAEMQEKKPSVSSRFKAPQFKASSAKPPSAFFEHESSKFRDASGFDSPDADSSDDPDSYDEDRKLVDLCTVWSVRDALQVQQILDAAGIPFFMGPEKATGVDEVTSNFAKGVTVQIMQIGRPWAAPGMSHYEPLDEPADHHGPKDPAEEKPLLVRCPACHSTEVVFDGGTSTMIVPADDSSQKFNWTCDSCGYQWQDDGVAKEE